MTTKNHATVMSFLGACMLTMALACGSNQVSIGEQNGDASLGGASGSPDAPVGQGGASGSPQGGASTVGSVPDGQGGSSGPLGSTGSNSSGKAGGSSGGNSGGGTSTGSGGADRCGGIAGLRCPTGSFCDYGACVPHPDSMGTCVLQPEICDQVYAPVCGCDGKTYSNDCMRMGAGVGKAAQGACAGAGGSGGTTGTGGNPGSGGSSGTSSSAGKMCGGIAGLPCATGEFCDYLAGTCGNTDASGTCFKNSISAGCTTQRQPVCGCNGKTYGNECERLVAGISKKSDGECPKSDGGAGGPAVMTPTLPATCQSDTDCCIALDGCMATAYLVGKGEYQAMLDSIASVSTAGRPCLACISPAVQVRCVDSVCTGQSIPMSSAVEPLARSHCGSLNVSADAGPSVHKAGGTVWHCGS